MNKTSYSLLYFRNKVYSRSMIASRGENQATRRRTNLDDTKIIHDNLNWHVPIKLTIIPKVKMLSRQSDRETIS